MIDFPDSPTNGQQFSSGGKTWTWDGVKWVNAACLPLTGGTLTGALNGTTATFSASVIRNSPATLWRNFVGQTSGSNRWSLNLGDSTAEGGANAGSNFGLAAFADDGTTQLSTPLIITRATGIVNINGAGASSTTAVPAVGAANLCLNKTGATSANIIGAMNGSYRWALILGTNAAETGGNVGSNFQINRYDDTGAIIDVPFAINRVSGFVGSAPSNGIVLCGASGTNRTLSGRTGATAPTQSSRWDMILGTSTPEGAGNAGSDFAINTFGNDGATYLGTPFSITRSTGQAFFSSPLKTNGYICHAGGAGAYRPNAFNIDWTTGAQLWIDATNTGTITVSSDYRIKKDVADLPSMWETAKQLRPISYTHKDFTPPVALERDADAKPLIVADDVERWGFVAHELQETLIQDAATGEKDSPDHIQSPNPWTVIATLTKALQEAMARIEALEAAHG